MIDFAVEDYGFFHLRQLLFRQTINVLCFVSHRFFWSYLDKQIQAPVGYSFVVVLTSWASKRAGWLTACLPAAEVCVWWGNKHCCNNVKRYVYEQHRHAIDLKTSRFPRSFCWLFICRNKLRQKVWPKVKGIWMVGYNRTDWAIELPVCLDFDTKLCIDMRLRRIRFLFILPCDVTQLKSRLQLLKHTISLKNHKQNLKTNQIIK